MDIKQILTTWKSFFSQSNIFYDLFIWIGWGLTMALKMLVDAAESVLDAVYGILSFTEWGPVKDFFAKQDLKVLLGLLLAAALVVCGVLVMFRKEGERPKLVKNLLFGISVIVLLPFTITTLNKLTLYSRDLIGGSSASTSDKILASCIVDMKYIDNNDKFTDYSVSGNAISGGSTNSFSGSPANATYIDPTEKINKDVALNNPDLFMNKLEADESGNLVVVPIKETVIPLIGWDLTSWYYRYNIDFFTLFISLIATGLAIFFTAFKTGRLIFEIAIHNTILPLVAIADANSGQRMKRVVQGIVNTYCVFFFTMLLIKFFFLGQEYMTTHISNPFIRGFLLIPFAAAVIDGPNIFQRILDIDVGLSSSVKTIMSIGAAAHTAKGLASAPGRILGRANSMRHARQDRKMNRERLELEKQGAAARKDYYTTQKQNSQATVNNQSGGPGVKNDTVNHSTNSATINQSDTGGGAAGAMEYQNGAAGAAAAGTAAAADTESPEKNDSQKADFNGINDTSPTHVSGSDMVGANPELSERQKILAQADMDNNSYPEQHTQAPNGYWAERPQAEKPQAEAVQGKNQATPGQTPVAGSQSTPVAPAAGNTPAAPQATKAAPLPQPEPVDPGKKTGKKGDKK